MSAIITRDMPNQDKIMTRCRSSGITIRLPSLSTRMPINALMKGFPHQTSDQAHTPVGSQNPGVGNGIARYPAALSRCPWPSTKIKFPTVWLCTRIKTARNWKPGESMPTAGNRPQHPKKPKLATYAKVFTFHGRRSKGQ